MPADKKDLTFCTPRCIIITHLPVAQLDSASDSDSEGRRFESFRAGQKNTDGDFVPIGVLLSSLHGFEPLGVACNT